MLDRAEAIKVLRNNGAKLNEKDKDGMTPFLSAVDNGHQASATLLLRLGADPNTRDKRQRSCIHVAVENEDTTMLAALLQETGPELLDGRDKRGRTPIHYAALSRRLEVTLESPVSVLFINIFLFILFIDNSLHTEAHNMLTEVLYNSTNFNKRSSEFITRLPRYDIL